MIDNSRFLAMEVAGDMQYVHQRVPDKQCLKGGHSSSVHNMCMGKKTFV